MDARCYLCKKKIKHGEDYVSINKGNYSEEGDEDWIALIFHDSCWVRIGKIASRKLLPIFQIEA